MEKRIKADKRKPGVVLKMSKSDFVYDIAALINDGAINLEDIAEFTDELKETVKFLVKM